MRTREATAQDVPVIVEMGRHFLQDVYPTDLVFNPEAIVPFAQRLIQSDESAILLAMDHDDVVVGMLALMAYPHPMSGERVVAELCWWVEPAARGVGMRLFRAAEAWSVAHGAEIFQMTAPSQKVAQFYERQGFKPLETSYQRRVTCR